jgi:nucleoside-diphosphate-sugar epimerase
LGDGSQCGDFTFGDNAGAARELPAGAGPAAVGQVMNIGCDERITLLDLVAILNELLEVRLEPVFTAPRPGDVRHSLASISRAEQLIGYRPLVGVREGIARTVEWLAEGVEPSIQQRR